MWEVIGGNSRAEVRCMEANGWTKDGRVSVLVFEKRIVIIFLSLGIFYFFVVIFFSFFYKDFELVNSE